MKKKDYIAKWVQKRGAYVHIPHTFVWYQQEHQVFLQLEGQLVPKDVTGKVKWFRGHNPTHQCSM